MATIPNIPTNPVLPPLNTPPITDLGVSGVPANLTPWMTSPSWINAIGNYGGGNRAPFQSPQITRPPHTNTIVEPPPIQPPAFQPPASTFEPIQQPVQEPINMRSPVFQPPANTFEPVVSPPPFEQTPVPNEIPNLSLNPAVSQQYGGKGGIQPPAYGKGGTQPVANQIPIAPQQFANISTPDFTNSTDYRQQLDLSGGFGSTPVNGKGGQTPSQGNYGGSPGTFGGGKGG